MGNRRQARPRRREWTVVCAGRALTLALALTLVLLLLWRRPLPAWLLSISATALVFYGYDKWAAQKGELRVPERVLLGLALLGGSPGAILGMALFHHKTRKGAFLLPLAGILLLQLLALLLWRYRLAGGS